MQFFGSKQLDYLAEGSVEQINCDLFIACFYSGCCNVLSGNSQIEHLLVRNEKQVKNKLSFFEFFEFLTEIDNRM